MRERENGREGGTGREAGSEGGRKSQQLTIYVLELLSLTTNHVSLLMSSLSEQLVSSLESSYSQLPDQRLFQQKTRVHKVTKESKLQIPLTHHSYPLAPAREHIL